MAVRSRIWFTADLHLGHETEWMLRERPFASAKEGCKALMDNWNACITPGDLVYLLGDFCWWKDKDTVNRAIASLNGTKILIQGNHDWKAVRNAKGWAKVTPLETIRPQLPDGSTARLTLCHYPMRAWPASHHGSWHLHGHSHCKGDPWPGSLDVGVDGHDFMPWSLEEVCERLREDSARGGAGEPIL